jgi:hypothetical protein
MAEGAYALIANKKAPATFVTGAFESRGFFTASD